MGVTGITSPRERNRLRRIGMTRRIGHECLLPSLTLFFWCDLSRPSSVHRQEDGIPVSPLRLESPPLPCAGWAHFPFRPLVAVCPPITRGVSTKKKAEV